jgi:hypothetical protein
MGNCQTCGGNKAAAAPADMYEVTLPSGEVRTLDDHESRVAMTMAGGGTRKLIKK